MRPPHLRSFWESLTWSGAILFGLAVAARAMARFRRRGFPTLKCSFQQGARLEGALFQPSGFEAR